MMGTPNAGTPWARIRDWATASLSLALNGLTSAFWPAKALGTLVSAIEAVDVTLDQMLPGSKTLNELVSSPDPHVPYVMVAGDTAIRPEALRADNQQGGSSVLQRLLNRLSFKGALRLAADQVFFSPNDLAVSVASATSLGSVRSPAPQILQVACDHISFFTDPASLEVLARALTEGESRAASPPSSTE